VVYETLSIDFQWNRDKRINEDLIKKKKKTARKCWTEILALLPSIGIFKILRSQTLRLCYENIRTCFLKDAENLTTYGYVL